MGVKLHPAMSPEDSEEDEMVSPKEHTRTQTLLACLLEINPRSVFKGATAVFIYLFIFCPDTWLCFSAFKLSYR